MPEVLFDRSGPVATMTFNKPEKANAFDPAWIPSMIDFITAAGA